MVRPRRIGETRLGAQDGRHILMPETFHALTDRALVAAVAWKYIAYNPTSNIKPSKRHGSASTVCPNAIFLRSGAREKLDQQGMR